MLIFESQVRHCSVSQKRPTLEDTVAFFLNNYYYCKPLLHYVQFKDEHLNTAKLTVLEFNENVLYVHLNKMT